MFRSYAFISLVGIVLFSGCQDSSSSISKSTPPSQRVTLKESLPLIFAPAFEVFHQQATIVTLVVPQQTSDLQVENLIWLLRDSSHSKSLNSLGISQTLVDDRNPLVSFQIYRGVRCADEHYGKGPLPCGPAEHEAGWYMYGNFSEHDGDSAVVYHGAKETKGEALWEVNTPYSQKPFIRPAQAQSGQPEANSAKTKRAFSENGR